MIFFASISRILLLGSFNGVINLKSAEVPINWMQPALTSSTWASSINIHYHHISRATQVCLPGYFIHHSNLLSSWPCISEKQVNPVYYYWPSIMPKRLQARGMPHIKLMLKLKLQISETCINYSWNSICVKVKKIKNEFIVWKAEIY